MRSPIAERALSVFLALAVAPSACRDDKPPPPVENPGGKGGGGAKTGGTGGARTGGTGGSRTGGASGTGGGGGVAAPDASPDSVAPVDGVVAGEVGSVDGSGSEVGGEVAPSDGRPSDAGGPAAMRPFYNHPVYPAGVIRPTDRQPMLDSAVGTFYNAWKREYVVNGCSGSFVVAPTDIVPGAGTSSVIHGAGMIATVVMAGHDPAAKTTYDNMFKFARQWKSAGSPVLMAHLVNRTGTGPCSTVANVDAQTDGDMHIALSLLMADKQWGSAGSINYLEEGKKTIAAIKARQFNPATKLPFIADYAATNPTEATRVRSSDLMPGHFQAFATATGDAFWNEAVVAAYALIGKIQSTASTATGLLPEYIINTNTATPIPATGTAGYFGYEAARVPIFLAQDYITNSTRAQNGKPVLDKINAWIKTKTGGLPAMVIDGYQLNGNNRPGTDVGESPLFEAAFGAGAIVDASNQAWLDAIWARAIRDAVRRDSNIETHQLLALIVASGHWW